MALDNLKRQGKSAAVGLLGKNLRRVAGNIGNLVRGDITGPDSSESAPINRNKQGTNMLSFPIDVGADPGIGNHGHYVMFMINEQANTKLKFGDETEKPAAGAENLVRAAQQKGISSIQKKFDSKLGGFIQSIVPDSISKNLISGFTDTIGGLKLDTTGRVKHNPTLQASRVEDKESTIVVDKLPTTRLDTVINMYMPTNAKVSYGAEYTDTTMGAAVPGIIEALMGNVGLETAVDNAMSEVGAATERAGLKALTEIPGLAGAVEAAEMAKGVVMADRMELVFKGIGKRKFTFEFKMMPRSQDEADEIQRIIYAFKFNMLPEFAGSLKSRQMRVPNTFDIQYMYQNAENNYLNKISTCYLETMDVTYGGARYKTFDSSPTMAGAPPVETTMTLSFIEQEIITRERVREGF